jgi:hypothetical protein
VCKVRLNNTLTPSRQPANIRGRQGRARLARDLCLRLRFLQWRIIITLLVRHHCDLIKEELWRAVCRAVPYMSGKRYVVQKWYKSITRVLQELTRAEQERDKREDRRAREAWKGDLHTLGCWCGRCGRLDLNPRSVRCNKSVTRVSKECYKSVTRVLQDCNKSVTRVLRECYKSVARVLQECCKSVARALQRVKRVLHTPPSPPCTSLKCYRFCCFLPKSVVVVLALAIGALVLQDCYKIVTRLL